MRRPLYTCRLIALTDQNVPFREKRQKSYECFVDELKRCEELSLKLYNFQCDCLYCKRVVSLNSPL